MSTDLPATLARLETWLSAHAPAIHAQLTPGVTGAELDALEAHTGLKLPEAYRILYKTHGSWGGTFGLGHMPLGSVLSSWNTWRDLEPDSQETEGHVSHPPGAIKPQYINLGWIPLLEDRGGNEVGVDLKPGPTGKVGQIITYGRDEEHKYVLAPGLEAFLTEYVARLESGRVRVVQLEGFSKPTWDIQLTDSTGHSANTYSPLTDFYPGFGAAPARRSR
ncbi:SMI1/KNR4 family protein [Deinococcus aetherius]|uniref:SMI1/KNR4 family protein n=1 Tax=Deinococcus aetherius TaxID=200252 RepID=UPI0022327138|nr:SMI1/KNR4 family protein [Deinococcus aetherius]